MLRYMWKAYWNSLLSAWEIFGFGKVLLYWLAIEPMIKIFVNSILWLDNIFYPDYKKIEVKKPIFIIGHPRSGTTFVHHLFAQTGETAAFKFWHIFLCPALTARKILKPIFHGAIRKGKDIVFPKETGHEIRLGKSEEEEMLFLHRYGSQFTAINVMGFTERDTRFLRFNDCESDAVRMSLTRWLKGLFRRQIYYTGRKQVVAQMHFSAHRIKTLLEVFPDAKFIFVLRDPCEVLPSFLSMLRNYMPYCGMVDFPEEAWQTYCQNRYQAALDLYRYFFEIYENDPVVRERTMILSYTLLRDDLGKAFAEMVKFTGIEVSDELRKKVGEQASKQKGYKSQHKNSTLEEFGFSREQVARDFSFVKLD